MITIIYIQYTFIC